MQFPRNTFVMLGLPMCFVAVVWGQSSPPSRLDMRSVLRTMQAPGGGQQGTDEFVITGSPYSCEVTTEITRTATDGTNFHRQPGVVREYRDSYGRTRTESPGPAGDAGQAQTLSFIRDPVGQVLYVLDSQRLTAFPRRLQTPGAKSAQELYQTNLTAPPRSPYVTRQPLGPQTMEGVYVEGFRFVTTFPAGIFGNDRAFVVTEERWVAPDMALRIFIKRSDPRFGQTLIRRTNISRVELDPALFQVPANYTVVGAPAAPR